jgi:hypothetical protein
MRRLPSVSNTLPVFVLATLLAVLLLVPAAAASAAPDDAPPAAVVVLAAEEGEGPVGPEPNPDTTHAPAEYEPPFLINAAVGLTALLVLGVLALGGLYWLLVQRPKTRQQA